MPVATKKQPKISGQFQGQNFPFLYAVEHPWYGLHNHASTCHLSGLLFLAGSMDWPV